METLLKLKQQKEADLASINTVLALLAQDTPGPASQVEEAMLRPRAGKAPPAKRKTRGSQRTPAAPGPKGRNGIDQEVWGVITSPKVPMEFSTYEVHAHFKGRPRKSINDAFVRLRQKGLIERVGYGKYRLPQAQKKSEPAQPAGLTDAQSVLDMVAEAAQAIGRSFTLPELKQKVAETYPSEILMWGAPGAIAEALRKLRESGDISIEDQRTTDGLAVYQSA